MEEEQHVCLPAGFNLKHMYWLPLPSQLRFETTTAQFLCLLIWSRPWLGRGGGGGRTLDPFPCPSPPVAQESGLDTALWTEWHYCPGAPSWPAAAYPAQLWLPGHCMCSMEPLLQSLLPLPPFL